MSLPLAIPAPYLRKFFFKFQVGTMLRLQIKP